MSTFFAFPVLCIFILFRFLLCESLINEIIDVIDAIPALQTVNEEDYFTLKIGTYFKDIDIINNHVVLRSNLINVVENPEANELNITLSSYEIAVVSFLEGLIDNNIVAFLCEIVNSLNITKNIEPKAVFILYKVLLRGYHVYFPPNQRLEYLGYHMRDVLVSYELFNEIKTQNCTDKTNIWKCTYLHQLLEHERFHSQKFYRYDLDRFQPMLFNWSRDREVYSSKSKQFEALQQSDQFDSLWKKPLLLGFNFFHHQLYTSTLEFYPYRNERICHVFHFLQIYDILQLWPQYFTQIIEYGGGTGDNIGALRELGFEGIHKIYDFTPMLLFQQYFARLSGHAAFFQTSISKEYFMSYVYDSAILVPTYVREDNIVSFRDNDEIMKRTLILATYSLTETEYEDRDKFLRAVTGWNVNGNIHGNEHSFKGVGFIYIAGNVEHYGLNNYEYMLNITNTYFDNYNCVFIKGNFKNEFFYLATRKDIEWLLSPKGNYDRSSISEFGKCDLLTRVYSE